MSTVDAPVRKPGRPRKSEVAPKISVDKPRRGAKPKPGSPADRKRNAQRAARALKMCANDTRLQILSYLSDGEHNVTELTNFINTTQPNTSHHLKLLSTAGLVEWERRGKSIFYNLTEMGAALANVVKGV